MVMHGKDKIARGVDDKLAGVTRERPGLAQKLAADEAKRRASELTPFLPNEMIGGSVPFIPGTEEEAVWNAAAQACGTDRVHFTYTIDDGRCWYLAVPSSALASNPDTWCPLAAALPGNSEHWDKQTVYMYESEGAASALRWDPETNRMQLFLGPSRTILPRIQSMDANFVTINPDMARVVQWRNRALRQERLARASSWIVMLAGLVVVGLNIAFLAFSYTSIALLTPDLSKVRNDTQEAVFKLARDARNALRSDVTEKLVSVQEKLDALASIDGTLVRYEIDAKGGLEWEALVPQAIGGNTIRELQGKVLGKDEDSGRIRIMGTR